MLLGQMAGDKKGKGKMVVQKKKKRTREDRGESKLRQLQTQQTGRVHSGSEILRLRGSHSSSYIAQNVLRQLRSHLSPAHVHGLEVVVLRGEQVMHSSSTPTVALRQEVKTVVRSCPRLSYLISGVFQDLGSRD
jgi:hypothetical protein